VKTSRTRGPDPFLLLLLPQSKAACSYERESPAGRGWIPMGYPTWMSCHSRSCLPRTGTVLQFGDAKEVAPVPATAAQGVSLVEAEDSIALAWKGPPSNSLVTWSKRSTPILSTLAANLATAGQKPVLQMTLASAHALILRNDGSLVAGYMPFGKQYALPPKGLVKGRLVRISASSGVDGDYTLGVDMPAA
jgi:hypothetical protein